MDEKNLSKLQLVSCWVIGRCWGRGGWGGVGEGGGGGGEGSPV